ncbi:MAG: retropepsin-like domain-containing protein [Prolixibacteraceae bacterium]|nr:retropepsin-like domain-containing protein [Prolixibacteraceae bacterium]
MKIKIPIQLIELEEGNFHILVTARFSDGTSGNWAIDTGASKTVFDKNLSEKLAAASEESMEEILSAGISETRVETTPGTLNTFFLGKLKIKKQKVALLDLTHINELYEKTTGQTICGLLGGDFLLNYKATIDYKNLTLKLQK